jgi:hypothetical protein
MAAEQWGMRVEILNALREEEQFGKEPLRDLKEEWK